MVRLILLAILVTAAGCGGPGKPSPTITLATTTSTRDCGLLEILLPMFEGQTGVKVKVIAVGSGQALELGRRGDADVLLTHAPQAEKQFVLDGHGSQRRVLMHNDYALVGPPSDPAAVIAATSIRVAFERIAGNPSPFVSRGDESGTHKKEQSIWNRAGIDPRGDWYIQAGSGMAQALRIADEKRAYTLTDRATFLSHRDRLTLVILAAGDPLLRNEYAVILVKPKKNRHVQSGAARRLADFLLSPAIQATIGTFGVEEFGEPLFFPVLPRRRAIPVWGSTAAADRLSLRYCKPSRRPATLPRNSARPSWAASRLIRRSTIREAGQ